MTDMDSPTKQMAGLRRLAEKKIAKTSRGKTPLSAEDEGRHELQVHRIELEMQNEELRRAMEELKTSRARYFEIFALAPVGYCTLNEHGLILEANLFATRLLGADRSTAVKQPLTRFIFPDDQDIYYRQRKNLVESGEPQACDLRMVKPDGTAFWAHWTLAVARGENVRY